MIKFNETILKEERFPDGTLRLLDFPIEEIKADNIIEWHYENDAEIFTLICVAKHINEKFSEVKITLNVPFFHTQEWTARKAAKRYSRSSTFAI